MASDGQAESSEVQSDTETAGSESVETHGGEPEFARRATTGTENCRYAAFVSYRHVEPDRKWAEWLSRALETYRVPHRLVKERGIAPRIGRVFRDEEELPASADLNNEIAVALQESRFLIVVCSPRTPQSEWVNGEVARFREMGRHDRILALLIEGEPAQSFPRSLVEIRQTITDGEGITREEIEEVEPLAADVRSSRKERVPYLKRMARLRLLACILGCRFDDLRQRELERRRSKALILGALAAGLLAVLGALMLSATRRMMVAERQMGAAKQQEEKALHREREAEEQRQRATQEAEKAQVTHQEAARTKASADYADLITSADRKIKDLLLNDAETLLWTTPVEIRGWEWGRLMYLCHPDLVTLKGHGNRSYVRSMAFSPDGKRIITGGDSTARIWDSETGEQLLSLDHSYVLGPGLRGGHNVEYVGFSPGGDMVITDTKDGPAIWEVGSGKRIRTLNSRGDYCFSPDWKHLVAWGRLNTGKLEVVDIQTDDLQSLLSGLILSNVTFGRIEST